MKKILSIAVMVLLTIQWVAAHDVVTKDEKQLPEKARNFISQHFAGTGISYIKIDNELFQGKKFEVVLTTGTEIEFDSKGEWQEVDSKRNAVPAAIIPAYISDYVKANFANEFITKIEKERHGLEVELNNDLSLKFDRKGNLRELDD